MRSEMENITIEEQKRRITRIMANDNVITCTDCKQSFVSFKTEFDDICPFCGIELFDEFEYYSE